MNYTIRPILTKDVAGLNELRRMPGVFENILGIPSEPLSRNQRFVENLDANTHQFVAVTSDEAGNELVIGVAGITVGGNQRKRHMAHLGMMIHKEYQNQGVGTKLLETLIDLADHWLMLIRLELTVFVDNERAIHLYKKFGFVEEGIIKKGAIRNGEYVDELMMGRIKNELSN